MPRHLTIAHLLVLGVLAAAVMGLEFSRQRHGKELAELRIQTRAFIRQHSENESANAGVARGAEQGMGAGLTFETERKNAREEIAWLEQRALARRSKMLDEVQRRKAADVFALTNDNRNPDKGLVKLEYFKDVARGTPRAALQTLVWAALKGENGSLASGFVVEGRARERAEVLLDALPQGENRAVSLAQLGALWFTSTMLDIPALTIVGEIAEDATHVTLIVRSGVGNEWKVPMQLGPAGWQIVVPEHAMEVVQNKMAGASPPLPIK
jgi:hypothetical protein